MSCQTTPFRIEPQSIYFGSNTYQKECITCVADVAASLNNKYFVFYTPAGVKHYAWFNVATGGVDPAIAGATAHAVAIASGASAGTVASALQAVIDVIVGFDAALNGESVEITQTAYGYSYGAHDGYTGAKTGFSFSMITAGSVEEDLGSTDGDISLKIEETLQEILTHQNGSVPVDSIVTGRKVTVSATLKEVTKSKIQKIMQNSGADTLLPNGANATALSGFGTGNLFRSVYVNANQFRLHPVKKGDADKSEDIVLPKAKISFGEMTFSGEDVLMLPIEIVAYPDAAAKFSILDMMTFGDYSQSL